MKVDVGNRTFEFLVDGRPLAEDEVFEAFVALGSSFFSFAVVTKGADDEAAIRAVTFAADEKYVDTLLEKVEPEEGEEVGVLGLGDEDEEDEYETADNEETAALAEGDDLD